MWLLLKQRGSEGGREGGRERERQREGERTKYKNNRDGEWDEHLFCHHDIPTKLLASTYKPTPIQINETTPVTANENPSL